MEVIHYDNTGASLIHLKVKYHDTNFTRNNTNAAVQEYQKFIVTSVEKSEEQVMVIKFNEITFSNCCILDIIPEKICITTTPYAKQVTCRHWIHSVSFCLANQNKIWLYCETNIVWSNPNKIIRNYKTSFDPGIIL